MVYTPLTEILKGKGLVHTLALIVTVAFFSVRITAKIGNEAHRVEGVINKKFFDQHTEMVEMATVQSKRMDIMQTQLDNSWTIHMQSLYDMMIAAHNTNHWTPDSLRISEAIKGGRIPEAIRISP